MKPCFYLHCLLLCIYAVNGVSASTSLSSDQPNLLNLTDRGSITNTPYTLPANSMLLEIGYQYQSLLPSSSLQNFAQPTLFYGLPAHSELIIVFPTHYQQSHSALSGISATSFGFKHELRQGENWITAIELLGTAPSGSAVWGSSGFGVTLNEIILYHLSSKLDVTFMLGESSLTDPNFYGGARFNSINPSLSLSFSITENLSVFAEGFAKTKTSNYQRDNENIDYGLLYMIYPNLVFDIEMGQQLSHQSGLFKQFINSGLTLQF